MLSLQTPRDTIILHMCAKNLDMIYSSWDIECTDETEIGNYGSFFAILPPPPSAPPNNPENFEKMKYASGDVTILHMYTKNQSYDVCFLRYGTRQREFFVI